MTFLIVKEFTKEKGQVFESLGQEVVKDWGLFWKPSKFKIRRPERMRENQLKHYNILPPNMKLTSSIHYFHFYSGKIEEEKKQGKSGYFCLNTRIFRTFLSVHNWFLFSESRENFRTQSLNLTFLKFYFFDPYRSMSKEFFKRFFKKESIGWKMGSFGRNYLSLYFLFPLQFHHFSCSFFASKTVPLISFFLRPSSNKFIKKWLKSVLNLQKNIDKSIQ